MTVVIIIICVVTAYRGIMMNKFKKKLIVAVLIVCAILLTGHIFQLLLALTSVQEFVLLSRNMIYKQFDETLGYYKSSLILNVTEIQIQRSDRSEIIGKYKAKSPGLAQLSQREVFTIMEETRINNAAKKDNADVENFGFVHRQNCSRSFSGVEDILCMNRPTFHPDFRNPCWYQNGRLRCLPYFHIIGVCKSGTSDLFRRLSLHPEVLGNKGILGKETWYWTWRRYGHVGLEQTDVPKMPFDDFIDHFDAATIEKTVSNHSNRHGFHPLITGHGDPMDFWDQTSWRLIPQNDVTKLGPDVMTASLIKHVNPDIKLILMLRDPVERLYSHYLHGYFGTTSEQFHDDVVTSLSILELCTEKLSMRTCLYSSDLMKQLMVPLSASFYTVHLKEWLNVFPREQILIMRTEDFAVDATAGLNTVFNFLGISLLPDSDLDKISKMPTFYRTKAKSTAGSIKPETRALLERLFEPYNQDLANLLRDEKYLWKSTVKSSTDYSSSSANSTIH